MVPHLGWVLLFANIVTPIVGVTCGLIAQRRYVDRLHHLPPKVAEGMPKRFPMADLLICLFMLGPILGVANLVTLPDLPTYDPSGLHLALRWLTFAVLIPVNLSGPSLVEIGMPPDGSFTAKGVPPAVAVSNPAAKPVMPATALFDAREI